MVPQQGESRTCSCRISKHRQCLLPGRTKAPICLQRSAWQTRERGQFWLKNQCERMRVRSRQSNFDSQLQRGLNSELRSRSPRTCRLGDELQNLCEQGELHGALHLLSRIDEQGIVPSVDMYKALLKACGKRKALVQARLVHAHLVQHKLDTRKFLGEYVVTTLVKCGGMADALQVFDRLPRRTLLSWTAIIAGYTASGQDQEALRMYWSMKDEGVEPNAFLFTSLLVACGRIGNLEEGKRIHAEALRHSCESDLFVHVCLVNMYAKCGSLVHAQDVFDDLSERDVVSWNVILAAYARQGQPEKTLKLYEQMLEEGANPNNRTFVSTIQACGMLAEEGNSVCGEYTQARSLERGKAMHAAAWRNGYESDLFVGSTLISMYGKCGSIVDAEIVFERLSQPNVVSWTAMLAAYVQQGQSEKVLQLYEQMQEEGISPNDRTFVSTIQACGMLAIKEEDDVYGGLSMKKYLEMGRIIHARSRIKGYDTDVFVCNTLISMYGKCGSVMDAQCVFDRLSKRNVVSWNAILVAYVDQGKAEKALQLYKQMLQERATPDGCTFVIVLQACGTLAENDKTIMINRSVEPLDLGKAIHLDVQREGYDLDIFVCNSLMRMYGKCGSVVDAQQVFDGLPQKNVASWNAIIMAYADHGQAEKALKLYDQMQDEGVGADARTFVSTLHACGMLAEMAASVGDGPCTKLKLFEKGKEIHANCQKNGYELDTFVGSTLISMYGKCGSISDGQKVFDLLSHQTVVPWNAILSAYVEHGQGDTALQLYRHMQDEGVTANEITFLCVVQACSNTGRLALCRQIQRTVNQLSPHLANCFIHAYGKCASMVDAQKLFDCMPQPDVVTWTALISGYAQQGNWVDSIRCYEEMLIAGVEPNAVTFLSLLSACSHAGLVDSGVEYFESMCVDYSIAPGIWHYIAMVDLLGRAGYFTTVKDLLTSMPIQPDLALWICLLNACRNHCKIALGKQAFDCAVHLQPKHSAPYRLMSSIYTHAGLWNSAKEVEELRQKAGAWKKPVRGQSWIEYDREEHYFVVGDNQDPRQEQLYDLIGQLRPEL